MIASIEAQKAVASSFYCVMMFICPCSDHKLARITVFDLMVMSKQGPQKL